MADLYNLRKALIAFSIIFIISFILSMVFAGIDPKDGILSVIFEIVAIIWFFSGIITGIIGIIYLVERKSFKNEIKREETLKVLPKKIIEASKTYTRIEHSILAKILDCKKEDLLNQISQLVNEQKIRAKIDYPIIIFISD